VSEYGSLLQRQIERVAPPTFTVDDVRLRRDRRRRNQRAASVTLSLVLGALLLILLDRGLGGLGNGERLPASPPINPSNVSGLRVSWAGNLDVGPMTSATVSGKAVYVGNGASVRAFSSVCGQAGTRCTPQWLGGVDGQIDEPVTASGGVVYVGSNSLMAFRASCAKAGATCHALWTTSLIGGGHAIGTPAVSNGVVYASTGEGRLYAFPASCGTSGAICHPLWVGRTGSSVRLSAPVVSGSFVYVASDRVYAFRAQCATRSCRPVWSGALRSEAFAPPVVYQGTVYVGADALYAFPTKCPAESCRAVWTWRPPGEAGITGLAASSSRVFVVADRLYALPSTCIPAAKCRPTWATPVQAFSSPTVADGLVFVTTNRLWAFPVSCATGVGVCKPAWVSPVLGFGALPAPTVTRNAVYVTSSGRLYALAISGEPST
jgi:outer membrane protein assembly factor BamB